MTQSNASNGSPYGETTSTDSPASSFHAPSTNGHQNGNSQESLTEVTRRTQHSTRSKLLQTGIKPFGTRLIKPPKKPVKDLSPELSPPEEVFDHCNVSQRQLGDVQIRVYDLDVRSQDTRDHFIPAALADLKHEKDKSKVKSIYTDGEALRQVQTHESEGVVARDFAVKKNAPRRKQIYYFCGGSWQSPASREHWKFCAHLCEQLNKRGTPTTVSIVSYPLAPTTTASRAYKHLENFYHEILPSKDQDSPGLSAQRSQNDLTLTRTRTRIIVPDDEIIFAGDSSGGNIVLGLTLLAISKDSNVRRPSSLLVISPAVDLRNQNPDMHDAGRKDPLMSLDFVSGAARTWVGQDLRLDDWLASPLLADLSLLAGIRVNGVIGLKDVLAPDAVLFRKKCQQAGLSGEWLEWEKQIHCFPLAFSYGFIPEATDAVEWILNVLADRKGGL